MCEESSGIEISANLTAKAELGCQIFLMDEWDTMYSGDQQRCVDVWLSGYLAAKSEITPTAEQPDPRL